MQCLNIKNKEVAALLKEYTDILGSYNAAYYVISENNGYGLDKAPNGASSKLFSDLLNHYSGDKALAVQAKAKTYSNSFKEGFSKSKLIDKNGEPTLEHVNKYNNTSFNKTTASKENDRSNSSILPLFKNTLFNGVESTTPIDSKTFLNNLIENDMIPDRLVALVNVLLDKDTLGKVQYVNFTNPTSRSEILGFYSADTTMISINAEMFNGSFSRDDIVENFLHELVHRYTRRALRQPVTNKEIKFSEEISKVYNEYLELDPENDSYGFTNEDEFMAVFMTRPEFRELLTELDKKHDKNLLVRILDAIRKLLGLKKRVNKQLRTNDLILEIIAAGNEENILFDNVDFVNNPTRYDVYNKLQSTKVDESKLVGVATIDSVYKKLVPQLEARLKDIRHFKVLDTQRIDKIKILIQQLNKLEAEKQIFAIIPEMSSDVKSAADRIRVIAKKARLASINNEDYSVDADQLLQIKRGFIGYYSAVIDGIKNVLNDPVALEFYKKQGVSDEDIQTYLNNMQKIDADYNDIVREYKNLVTYQTTKLLVDYAKRTGLKEIDELKAAILKNENDINALQQYVASPVHLKDTVLGIMTNMILNSKNAVGRKTLTKGKELVDVAKSVSKDDRKLLLERDRDGNLTGNIIRELNYGQMRKDLETFKKSLADKYKLEDIYQLPKDEKDLKEYNKAMNKWLDEHVERKFNSKYYDAFNELSEEAKLAKHEIDVELSYYYGKVTDKDGIVRKEQLSNKDWMIVQSLLHRKRNLSNRYDLFGTAKVGLEAEIASQIRKLNDTLNDLAEYVLDKKKFLAAYNKAKSELSGKLNKDGQDLFKLWVQRNTVVKVRDKFYDSIKGMFNEIEDPRYKELKSQRNDLKKLYKDQNGNVNPTELPDSVREEWVKIEHEMRSIEAEHKVEGEEKSDFFKHAEIVIDENYEKEYEQAELQGEEYLDKWLSRNGMVVNGKYRVASFWTQLVPKDNTMWERVPTPDWNEIAEDSPLRNKNFDESQEEYLVPKKSLYDNSREYNKVKSNANLSALRDKLISTYEEANEELTFAKNTSKYRVAQIEDGVFQTAFREKGLLNKISRLKSLLIERSLTIQDSDTEYVPDRTARADGTELKLVPTRFMKALDNPNDLSTDVVGSAITYYNMAISHKEMLSKSSELELIKEQLGLREFKDGKTGDKSNTYKKAEQLIDNHIYGITRKKHEVNIPFTNKKVSLGKISGGASSYVRAITLAHNPYVILTGYITNWINTRIEAISGTHFDKNSLKKADIEMTLNLPKAMANIGELNHNNKIIGIMEYNQVVFDNQNLFERLDQSKVGRILCQHFWYGGHTLVDYETKGRIALAVYFNYRLVDNKFLRFHEYRALHPEWNNKKAKQEFHRIPTTLYDAYEMKDNKFVLKDAYKDIVPTLLEDRVMNTIKQIGSRIDGQLSDIDRAAIHYDALGQFIVMFRNFIIQTIQTRYKARHFNFSTDMYEEGFYRSGFNVLKQIYNPIRHAQFKELMNSFENFTDLEKAAVRRIGAELIVTTIILPLIQSLLSKAAEDDDDLAKNALAYLATRSLLEMKATLPFNIGEILSILNSPAAATNTINEALSLVDVFEDPFTKIKRGPYEGFTKFERSLIRISPLKNYVEMWDPESKRLYLENQIMK